MNEEAIRVLKNDRDAAATRASTERASEEAHRRTAEHFEKRVKDLDPAIAFLERARG